MPGVLGRGAVSAERGIPVGTRTTSGHGPRAARRGTLSGVWGPASTTKVRRQRLTTMVPTTHRLCTALGCNGLGFETVTVFNGVHRQHNGVQRAWVRHSAGANTGARMMHPRNCGVVRCVGLTVKQNFLCVRFERRSNTTLTQHFRWGFLCSFGLF